MVRRRKETGQQDVGVSSPAQQDEADIVEEAGAELDEEGNLVADAEAIAEVGAVDSASVISNRRMNEFVGKKRGNVKGVTFNAGDLPGQYEAVIKVWPPNTLDIYVRRLTGTPVQHVIVSRPRSGIELYAAIEKIHGQHEEAEYEVKVLDSSQKQYRANGRITMPDTRGSAPLSPQPVYYPPNGAPPPGYAPALQAPPQQSPQVAPQVPAGGSDMATMMSSMRDMWALFQSMQPQPQPQPTPFAPPQQVFSPPPPPPPGSDVPTMMAWMKEMFGVFQSMQQAAPPAPQTAPQPYAAPPPQAQPPPSNMMQGPTTRPPPGMMWAWFPEFGSFALVPAAGSAGAGGPYRGGRPPYMPQGESHEGAPPPRSFGPPQAQQRPPSMVEQFRESIGVVKTAASMLDEMEGLLPGRGERQEASATPEVVDDDSPIKIIDTGDAQIAVNRDDGTMRLWESGFANLTDILKWGGEQITKINKAQNERQQQQQQRPPPQQLPPGYVEVHPGYVPPPGYVAVPVDPQQRPLPPPPEHLPPPIQQQASPPPPPPSRQPWGAPTITDQEES